MAEIMKINSRRVENMLSGYKRTLPQGVELGVDALTRFSAKTYGLQAQAAGIRNWRGAFFGALAKQTVLPRKRSRFSNYVFVPLHGIFLDRMRPHWVSLKRGRLITQWAKSHGLGLEGSVIRETQNKIFVRPHPYVTAANRIIGRNTKRIMEQEINRKIRRKGR